MSEEMISALLARPKFGAGPSLPRMRTIAGQLKDAAWLSEGRAIHVVGSQGKGTVTMLAAALFEALGVSCGRFISPHLFDFSERIQIAGRVLDASAFARAADEFAVQERAYLKAHDGEAFGSFEAATGVAFNAFSQAHVETAVLEAGIGGRHDATHAAGGRLAALTGIDLEHTALLGASERDILEDKSDICPPGGLLIAASLTPELRAALDDFAASRGFYVQHTDDLVKIALKRYMSTGALVDFEIDGLLLHALETKLFGAAQLQNAAQALLLTKRWLEHYRRWPGDDAFARAARRALADCALPLRFEAIAQDPLTILDVAHTRAALDALMETLESVYGERRCVCLFAASSDKDAARLIEPLTAGAAQFIFTKMRHRASDPARLPEFAHGVCAQICEDPATAYVRARDAARRLGCPLLVTGSIFLCAQIKMIAAGKDPAALKFL